MRLPSKAGMPEADEEGIPWQHLPMSLAEVDAARIE